MNTPLQHYEALVEKGQDIYTLKSISTLIGWDQETYMPKNAIGIRSLQKQHLESLIHKEMTSTYLQELLSPLIRLDNGELLKVDGLDLMQQGAVKEWRKDVVKAKKLPDLFVEAFAKAASETVSVWAEAKQANDFDSFLPYLEKMVELVREKTDYLGYKDHPYDALLEEYEPGMTVEKLDKLFDSLKPFLINLTKKCKNLSIQTDFLYGDYNEHKILELDHYLLQSMGFKEGCYRLDASNHPFCVSCHPTDVRMTTVTKTRDLLAANIFTVLHEGGHGLYEQGLDPSFFGTPICEFLSMGIHESQSKIWEAFIGQSLPFWTYFYPKLQESFPQNFSNVLLTSFYQAINVVEPSFIRIYADEVTYSLHVILRYEIEKSLIDGSLQVKDIPHVWNEKMQAYLGITPKNHREGCLQDIHWAWGLFGYFPTYVLGNLYAAQLFDSLKKDHPDFKEKVSQGHLTFIRDWLNEHIHRYGRLYSPDTLIQRATGTPLSEESFKAYLTKKYIDKKD
ncbi:MAG: carboxypeptidase M32 [Chlamydiota bacterium]